MSVLVNVADPLASALLAAAPPSTLNDTLPVTVPAVDVTVTVTLPLAL